MPDPLAMPGPLALVGAGEYLEVMLDVEAELLAGRPPRYVQIPTAAAPEGPRRLDYWVRLGRAQADRLGVTAIPLVVRDRSEADDPDTAAAVAGAGLIYLSGGNPSFLADTLRDTALWRAILAQWRAGAALAGCSAGAMALTDWVPDLRRPGRSTGRGLGLLPRLRVIPHFDVFLGRVPDLLTRPFLHPPAGVTMVGIDENTALVGGLDRFTVRGRQSVWVLGNGKRTALAAGAELHTGASPT
jgi:cyanophycinase